MKHYLILILSLLTTSSFAQVIHFDTKWRFIKGDDTSYKNEQLDDSRWQLRLVPSSNKGWEGLCWYRVRFTVPRQMIGKELVLFAGTIDAADQTFVNGKLVGASGKIYPKVETAWDQQRIYTIPAGVVRENNTLAVRVFNATAIGGIYKGRLALMTRDTYEREKKELAATGQSYFQLTTSNGLISAVYNKETDRVETLYPHIFANYDSAKFVSPVAFNISLKKPTQPLSVRYLDNTHVIEVKYSEFSVFYFAPFTTHEKILYAVVKGSPDAVKSIAFRYDEGKGKIRTSNYTINRNGVSEKYFLFGFTDTLQKASPKTRLAKKNASLLSEELQYMQSVFKRCKIPENATADEKALLQQSITILKMSQVPEQEVLPYAHGQIVASLRPGEWSMTWVRDGSFAIAAMAKLGLTSEAKKGLEFMLKAHPVGRFKDNVFRNGKDYGIGVDYQISATRYYGNGKEDCEAFEGPTIEIDDFGLFLFALDEYMKSSNDGAFYKQWEHVLSSKIADAITHNIDGDGLIRSDSGPWEHPLPGRRYTFTSGVCAEGLKRFAALQKKYGYEWKKYSEAADSMYRGIMTHMVYENRVIKGNADDQSPAAHYFHDAGTFELFANGLVTDKKLFETHMQDYDRLMKVKNDIGYIRVYSNDTYENQEWPFADLRVAVAQNHLGSRILAKGLIDKVTKLSKANFNTIPEMYMLGNCSFNGAIPMVGYGSGAYVLALLDYYGDDNRQAADTSHLRFSLITCGPGAELYSIWGHTAIRAIDSSSGTDVVFNYGTFDTSDPYFYLKFTRGIMRYALSFDNYSDFIQEYQRDHRSVTEQILLLTGEQKERLLNLLKINARRENRYYNYRFYEDNCTTRAKGAIDKCTYDSITFGDILPGKTPTYRELIHKNLDTYHQYWSKFGIDLLLGSNLDKRPTNEQSMFLPDCLMQGFDSAVLGRHPLVGEKKTILAGYSPVNSPSLITPFTIGTLLALAFVFLSFSKNGKIQKALNFAYAVFFFALGLLGTMILFVWIGRVDAVCKNNLNILWAWPTHIFVVFLPARKYTWIKNYFRMAALAALLMLLGWPWLPQQLNTAVIPLLIVIVLRPLTHSSS